MGVLFQQIPNSTYFLFKDTQIPGPRLSPAILADFENLEKSEKNVLFLEYSKAKHLYDQITKMYENGYIKKDHKLVHRNFDLANIEDKKRQNCNYPITTLHQD